MRDAGRPLRAAPPRWCAALAFWAACGTPTLVQPPSTATTTSPPSTTAPAVTTLPPSATEPAPPTDPASTTEPASAPEPVRPAQLLEADDLGEGSVARDFDVTASCPLARVELDLEVESMPDGVVTLRAPSGAEARLSLHVLTTTHFVRTWDWQRLSTLHALRGTDPRGRWSLSIRAVGATYQGGAQPSGSPMPTPRFPHAALRVFCEPAAHGEQDGAGVIDVHVPAEPAAIRSGANVRALVPITRECSIASLTIVLEERWRSEVGAELVLVTPSGRAIRVETGSPARLGAHPTFSRDVVDARGLSSAGLWEIVRPRAAGRVTIGEAGLQIDCAP